MNLVIWTEDEDTGDLVPLKVSGVKEADIERTESMQITSTRQGTIIIKDL